jgi:hypothetical protein
MAVANLNEVQFAFSIAGLPERPRSGDPGADTPNYSGAGPGHALEQSATVDAVIVMVVKN